MDECDDPYKILANNLVATCSDLELYRMLHDVKAIKRRIYREVTGSDFYGDFLDCILVGLVKTDRRKAVNRTLKETAKFFYNELDVPRLRKELKFYCDLYGRRVEECYNKLISIRRLHE